MSDRHLNILARSIEIANSSIPVDDKLRGILDLISTELGVDNCKVYLVDPGMKTVSEKAVNSGGYTGEEVKNYLVGSGMIGLCAATTQQIVINDISVASLSDLALVSEADRYSSFAALPITDGRVYGVLYLSNEKPMGLGEEDILALQSVSNIVAAILREGRLYAKAEKVVREFSILYDISTAMMTTIKLDKLMHIVLTAVTIGDGLGFNRALLFLVNERSNIIQGMMGVGPDSIEEAWRAWDEYSRTGKGLLEHIYSGIEEGKKSSSRIDEIVKTIRLPLDSSCIVARTVREQKPFNVTGHEEVNVSDELYEKLGMSAFASVPLMASGKVVGVIIVDNCFNKKPITDEDIRFLTMFANQAGLAVENSLLYSDVNEAHLELKETHERLLQSEKLAALGEMAANVAHEIRNPLTSLGGFARRLYKKLEGKTEKKYAEIMVKEVERLEKLLTDVLILSRRSTSPFKKQDVNRILDSTLQQLADEIKVRRIDLVKNLDEGLPKIDCDSQQLKQVLLNLITNAMQAMDNQGVLTVETYLIREKNMSPHVGISVTDTGGGITEKSLPNIFNPFFTTKDTGTGLGLSISHRIVAHHHGDIEVINRPGQGVTFIVKLPASRIEPDEQEDV